MASLAEHQQQVPVLVVAGPLPHRWVLIDGYARVRALRKLGRDQVWAMAPKLTETQALVLRQSSQAGRRPSALEEGWLVRELIDGHGYEPGEVARDLGRSTSWVSRRLGLVDSLPSVAQQAVRDGRICPFGAMKFLLPLARANQEQCKTLVTALGKTRVTSRQLQSLYEVWKGSDAIGRTRIVSEPLAVLRLQRDRHPELPAAALSRQLRLLCSAARRAHEHVQDITEQGWSTSLQTWWLRAQSAVGGLEHAIKEATHAGSGHTHGHSEAP
jgi:ParB/RepB/Spo0J family partition protein